MNFNDDLLIKPKNKEQIMYITKLSKSTKSRYKFIFLVNKENMVYGFCKNSQLYVENGSFFKRFDKKELGVTKKRYNEITGDTEESYAYYHLYSYNFNGYVADCLGKRVRGVRYTDKEESCILRQFIVKYLSDDTEFNLNDYLYNSDRYNKVYRLASELGILGSLFEYEKNNDLEKYEVN